MLIRDLLSVNSHLHYEATENYILYQQRLLYHIKQDLAIEAEFKADTDMRLPPGFILPRKGGPKFMINQ